MAFVPTVCFDFDGVIHSYKSAWKGPDIIPDPPVPGMLKVFRELKEKGYIIGVVSTRALNISGKKAIEEYLKKYDFPFDFVTSEKVPCVVMIDDRAITFDGNCNTLVEKITTFKPWNRKE